MSTRDTETAGAVREEASPEPRDMIAMQIAFKRVAKLRQEAVPGANPELGGYADIQNCLDAYFESIRFGEDPAERLDALADVVAAAVVAMAGVLDHFSPAELAAVSLKEVA